MASLIPGYEYDIFISYRQKDNKYDGWVTEFVDNLKKELEATFKEEISVYFDINPHDGLLETHDVDASLKEKLKCLVFIPIISRTFCDPKSFAWEHEFKAFIDLASHDQFGLKLKLPNGNVANRVLPIQIHELLPDDKSLIEKELGGVLRPIDFIYKEPGVNRPLRGNEDHPNDNLNKTFYRNQINKAANAIDELINSLKNVQSTPIKEKPQPKEPSEEARKEVKKREHEVLAKLIKHKLLSSAIILIVLIAIVLTFLKVLKSKTSLQTTTMTVSVINENGEKEIRRVFKEKYISKILLFPFTNETNDTLKNWLQYGIYTALLEDLLQFNYITPGSYNATNLQEQIKYAKTNNYSHFLTGAFRITEGFYEITSRLYNTANGTVKSERIFKGSDFFRLIDSISIQARIDLDITKTILNSSPDLPINEQMTYNLDAFRFFINGIHYEELKYPSFYININKAIELDSTFALALNVLARNNYTIQSSRESAQRSIKQAMRHRKRLSEYNDISTRILYYSISGENNKAVTLAEMQYELQPNNPMLLLELINTYRINFLVDKYEKAAKQLNKLIPNQPEFQMLLAESYLFSGKLDQGLDVLGKLLKDNPENVEALLHMGEIYLNKNDLEAAEKVFQKAILLQPEDEKYWSKIFDYIAYAKNNTLIRPVLERYTGNYKVENLEAKINYSVHHNNLMFYTPSQPPLYCYPISDTQIVPYDGFFTQTLILNKQNKVIKIIHKQRDDDIFYNCWKEDSLILKAINSLNKNNKTEALNAFHKAYAENPEHYYLANFIQHLEFIQSQEYERIKPLVESYICNYGDLKIFKENDQLYFRNSKGLIYKLLSLSETRFMVPTIINMEIQIVKKNNSVSGLKVIYRDGSEEFFSRNN